MSDEVMLHRSVSLDQMAEFDPNTGLWHSDGTFEVVRFHEVLPTDGKENVTHIALPAAKHAAIMRVVEAARVERLARLVYRDVRLVEPAGSDALKSLVWAENELIAAVDAYLATAPERQEPS